MMFCRNCAKVIELCWIMLIYEVFPKLC
jgi:hypothetical protein